MLKFLVIIITVFWAGVASSADFRNSSWGDSIKKVKLTEKKKPVWAKNEALAYKDHLAGVDVVVYYTFKNGKLVRGSYYSEEKHTNQNDHIDDHKKIVSILEKKYGEKFKDDVTWKNDMYKDDEQHWGLAVSMGQLTFFSGWKTDRSYISAILYGDNFNISNSIDYCEKTYFEAINKGEELDDKGL